MSKFYRLAKKLKLLVVIAALLALSAAYAPFASAATLTQTSVVETGGASNANPMIAGDGQALVVDFTAASTNTPSSITLTVNSGFTSNGGSVATSQTVANSNCNTVYFPSATPLPGGSLSAGGSGGTITISGVGALTSGTNYCTELTSTSAVTNPTAGAYSILLSVGSDTQTDFLDVLSSGANAYLVSASVASGFTLSLSSNSDALGTLSSTALTTSGGITATVATNAASGWFLWAEDANAGLSSTSSGYTIPSVTPGSNVTMNGGNIGTAKYALGVSVDGTTNYADGGGVTGGGLSNTAFNEIATSGSAGTATPVLKELADISATTPPANNYADTITVIGSGSF